MNEKPVGYKKLTVWKKADELVFQVYLITKNFLKEEIYGLTSQLRRAALSIPTNIVEGYDRQSKKDLKHFLNIALGSLAETKYLLYFSKRLACAQAVQYNKLNDLTEEVGRLLWKFYESL